MDNILYVCPVTPVLHCPRLLMPCRWDADELRTRFCLAMSDMYREEVPLYGDLVRIVREVDDSVLRAQGKDPRDLPARHHLERHGAIRLGSDHELRIIKRLFALLGMHPVGYYDLRIVDFPLHATAFRPTTVESLSRNPFRVFVSVLRKDLVSPDIRAIVEDILSTRQLFTPRLLKLLDRAEAGETMTSGDADNLITESLKIFKWHSRSTVPIQDYLHLKGEHMMIADIVCFPSAHINHLTPRTLDIDLVQAEMVRQGLPAKERIEGPPSRRCPILLRQTSFKALEEMVMFHGGEAGTHTARFGEVEQRGAVVTARGRALYDELLALALADKKRGLDEALGEAFLQFPDTWEELRERGLVYFRYGVTESGREMAEEKKTERPQMSIKDLLRDGLVGYEPITYEDFLPLSAVGIFKSNLGDGNVEASNKGDDGGLGQLEEALGCKVEDQLELYGRLEEESIRDCARELGVEISMDC